MNIIILDIETTGDNYNIDEICQLSYFILNENLHFIKAKNFFFKVDYIHFKSNKSKLNINDLKILSNNKLFRDNYEEIFNDLNGNMIICHNLEHDISFLNSEFLRCGIDTFEYHGFCTMKYYTDILKIKHDVYGYKYPKLEEVMPYLNIKRGDIVRLCDYYFNEKDINLHDSRFDTSILYYVVKNTVGINNIVNKIKTNKIEKNINNSDKSNSKVMEVNNNIAKSKSNKKCKTETNTFKNILFDLFSFKGRIGRKEYIFRYIFIIVSYISISLFSKALYYYNNYDSYLELYVADTLYYLIEIIPFIAAIFLLWLLLSTCIKRVHDINKKGIYILTLILPIIKLITSFKLILKQGDLKENNFGLPRVKDRCSNKTKKVITYGYIINIIVLLLCGSYVNNVKSTNIDKAIDLVLSKDSIEEDVYNRIYEINEERLLNDVVEYGWDALHIEGGTYLVSYDFDIDADDYNGYNCFPYEVNIYSGYVIKLEGDDMKEQYKDILGEYKNEFDSSWY